MEFLTRKIGPLPTWAWGALAVGTFVAYRLHKRAKAPPPPGQIPVALGDQSVLPNGAGFNLPISSALPVSAIPQTNGGTSTNSTGGGGIAADTIPGATALAAGTSSSGPSGQKNGNTPGMQV